MGNIDWPSQPGLSTQQQKAELLAILDRAVYLRLNAIIFQVRPSCDAFYASQLEPWSEYLTGQMGQPPNPPYDPLAFAVDEAHRRGLELHAWFNPYRARTPNARSSVPENHISKLHPEWVKSYGGYLWLDPGDKNVQEHILKVFLDVTRRYDIDGRSHRRLFLSRAGEERAGQGPALSRLGKLETLPGHRRAAQP